MKIIGLGSALPKLRVTNDMLSTFLDTSDEWISTRTGIKERRILSDEMLEDLAAEAVKKALAQAKITADEIDYIICSNANNEYTTPALACIIQGLVGADCPAVDANAACAGFVYALELAEGLLLGNKYNKILIVCAESLSKMVDWEDRATCVLFGDGVGAAIVEKSEDPFLFKTGSKPDKEIIYGRNQPGNAPYTTNKQDAIGMQMQGQEVYRFAVSAATEDIKELLDEAGLTPEEIKFFLLHQANQRIMNGVQKRLRVAKEAVPSNIAKYGNTSSASIPILLDELVREGLLQKGDKLVMSAFGAGLVTGACLFTWAGV
ncbi:MAG: beta-ketoacyl-ACP synthase III [Christensenellaceae bacterium]|jgi:3-oxoacyl-[acyl-carrier-protein] synthase-3